MAKRPGANTEAIKKIRVIAAMPPLPSDWKYKYDVVMNRIQDYFSLCEQYDILPTISNLAPAFGCDRRTIQRIISGESSADLGVQQLFIQAKAVLEAIMLDQSFSGDSNTIACVFGLKALHGYEETPKEEITVIDNRKHISIEDIQKRYAEYIVPD